MLPVAQILSVIDPPLHPAVAFVSPEYTFRMGLRLKTRGPIRHDGVLLGDAWVLTKRINKPGPLDRDQIERIDRMLATQLPPR